MFDWHPHLYCVFRIEVCLCLWLSDGLIHSVCFVCLGIDDEPEDGPQHYILMLGFYQPRLIAALDAIGVHVANVIKLWSEHTHTSEGQQERHTYECNEQSLRASPAVDAGDCPSVYNMHYCCTDLIKHQNYIVLTGMPLFLHLFYVLFLHYIIISSVHQKQRIMGVQTWLCKPGGWIFSGRVWEQF